MELLKHLVWIGFVTIMAYWYGRQTITMVDKQDTLCCCGSKYCNDSWRNGLLAMSVLLMCWLGLGDVSEYQRVNFVKYLLVASLLGTRCINFLQFLSPNEGVLVFACFLIQWLVLKQFWIKGSYWVDNWAFDCFPLQFKFIFLFY